MSTRIMYERPPIYDRLVDEHSVFKSYTDLFVFAGALGFQKGEKRPDHSGDKEMLWANVANTDIYETITASIAYQETSNPDVLSDPQRQLEILGQYSAGGVAFLGDRFDGSDDPTVELARFIRDAGADPKADVDSSLDGLI